MATIAPVKVSGILGTVVATTSASVGTDRTFGPEGTNPSGVISYVDRSGSQAINFPRLQLAIRPPANRGPRNYKVEAKIIIPTPDITAPTTLTGIQPAASKAYDCFGSVSFVLPERSTLAERIIIFNNMASLFFATIMASDAAPSDVTGSPLYLAVTNFEKPYG